MKQDTTKLPFLIAEIGINHNGDIDIAKKLIFAAYEAGFNAVKFQKRTIDLVYSKEVLDSNRLSPWGTTQREQKEGLEFSNAQFDIIDAYCKELGIDWTASAWDLESFRFIESFNVPFHKIASPMLGHKPLLEATAKSGKKTFISTGMSTIEEIDEVVEIFKKHDCPFELMHCNSTYPMLDESDANLRCIPMLKERYKCNVGYSGHEVSLLKVCTVAVALGATSIERHITLNRAMYGSDQAASIETSSLKQFVEVIRAVPGILGDGKKAITEKEMPIRDKLRREITRDKLSDRELAMA